MGTTTFSGPVKSGTVREGASANVGFLVAAQSAAITENGSASDTGIIIPANSQIINMYVLVQTAWDGGTNTVDVGISTDTDLYCDGLPATVVGNHRVTAAYTGTEANWKDVGTSDVTLYVDSVATGSGTGVLVVQYLQNRNLS
ncbi:MAG: hypothetical protein VX199_01075 [Chloroflexota bacterium]|nr:hypothetical protein [Chloroflexota bacterium]